MFESITIITLSLLAFCIYQNMDLGLTSKVPKDPKNRAHTFAAECMATVKERLAGATVVRLEESRVEFRSAKQPEGPPQALWSKDGQLWGESAEKPAAKLHELGESGKVSFEKLSETGLFVKIHAEINPQAQHDVGVRLEAVFP